MDKNNTVRLTRRPLTATEADTLHHELKTTANILGYTVRELRRFKAVVVAETDDQFVGACISKDLLFGWTDIAVLYVLPQFRGRKIGARLYTAAFEDAQARNRHIFTLSRCPEVIHLMERLGMETTRSVGKAPLAFHLHMSIHLSSWYRTREALRKAKMKGDGMSFIAGTRKIRR